MKFHRIIVLNLAWLCLLTLSCSAEDLTLDPRTSGQDVVEAVITKLDNSGIFGTDRRFLTRIAWVETKFGQDNDTYSGDYFGGIWKIDEEDFNSTQDTSTYPNLEAKFEGIQAHFGINWTDAQWSDLEKPFYSGLTARLFLANIEKDNPIPETIKTQAMYWKTFFTDNQESEQRFIDEVTELESSASCRGRLNMVVALDGSGSIGNINFIKAKSSVALLMSKFSLNTTRIGFLVFSDNVQMEFPIDNGFNSTEELEDAVLDARYPERGTNTHLAIYKATEMLASAEQENEQPETSIPKISVVFTDGQSTGPINSTVQAAGNATESGVTTFSVGIGQGINRDELITIANNDPNKVFTVTEFETLVELAYQLNSEACSIPQKPSINDTVEETLEKDERIYYGVDCPRQSGCTFTFRFALGSGDIFWSRTVQNPSPALHDGTISTEAAYIPSPKGEGDEGSGSGDEFKVYLTVQGLGEVNSFTMKVDEGDTVPAEITTTTVPPVTEVPVPDDPSTSQSPTTESSGKKLQVFLPLLLVAVVTVMCH